MQEFRAVLAENGRIIIPAKCREQLHLKPGDELVLQINDEELRIFSVKHALERAKKLVQKHAGKKNLVKQLKKMRNKDSLNE